MITRLFNNLLSPPSSPAPAKSFRDACLAKPSWVKRQIALEEASVLRHWIKETNCSVGVEIGVASGYSSALIFAALRENSPEASLHSFDISEHCYFDKSRLTGAAFAEIHGSQTGYHLKTKQTSADITRLPMVDFVFVDGHHGTPWPALDILSLGRFLKPGGWIALDDLDMMFLHPKFQRGKNGARDLFRSWKGPKLVYNQACGLGILYDVTPEIIVRSVRDSLLIDWDVPLSANHYRLFEKITSAYKGPDAKSLRDVMSAQRQSSKNITPLEADFLGIMDGEQSPLA